MNSGVTIKELKEEIAKLTDDVNYLDELALQFKTEYNNLLNEYDVLRRDYDKIEADNESYKVEVESHEDIIKEKDSTIEKLNNHLEEADEALALYKKEIIRKVTEPKIKSFYAIVEFELENGTKAKFAKRYNHRTVDEVHKDIIENEIPNRPKTKNHRIYLYLQYSHTNNIEEWNSGTKYYNTYFDIQHLSLSSRLVANGDFIHNVHVVG